MPHFKYINELNCSLLTHAIWLSAEQMFGMKDTRSSEGSYAVAQLRRTESHNFMLIAMHLVLSTRETQHLICFYSSFFFISSFTLHKFQLELIVKHVAHHYFSEFVFSVEFQCLCFCQVPLISFIK